MKYIVIFLVLALSLTMPVSSFAQQAYDCTFGGTKTPLQGQFAKDLAVKEFIKQHPNSTKTMHVDKTDNPQNQFVLSAKTDEAQETLALYFNIDENGCYIPARYHYSYNDRIIDVTIINTIGNFTEIMNLIKLDSKTIDDFYPKGCNLVDLEHSVTNGNVYGICKQGTSITILADVYSESVFTVDIPIEMVYSLPSSDCIPTGDFFVVEDLGSPSHEITPSDIGNLVKINLDEGFHRVRIAGSMIIPSPAPGQYCGIVEGYDKPYLPPLAQIEHDMKPTSVKCNEGLVLIQKYDGSPVCVTESTKQKLIERGWTNFTPIKPEVGKFGTYHLNQDGEIFDIKYHIQNGADIKEIAYISDVQTIKIILDAVHEPGSLEIKFPHKLFDSILNDDVHDLFFVLVDGQEIDYDETTSDITRTLTIPFEKDSEMIEIIGASKI